jgi:hypothetical protein
MQKLDYKNHMVTDFLHQHTQVFLYYRNTGFETQIHCQVIIERKSEFNNYFFLNS